MELNFAVDYSKSSPDFCVTSRGGYEFNVEAVISDSSQVSAKKISKIIAPLSWPES